MYSKTTTYLILFAGVFALSTSAIFVKLADAPSAVIAFYRLLIAGLMLFPLLAFNKTARQELVNLHSDQWKQITAAGIFLALHYVLWFESLSFTSITSSTMIVCLQPLFSLALDRFISNKSATRNAIIGCTIALAGCLIIGWGDFQISGQSLFGDVLAFLAGGIIALYFFLGEKVRQETYAITYSVLSYLISAMVLLAYITLIGNAFIGYTAATWQAFFGLAIISTIGGQFVFNLLLKNLPASAVTMAILGEPIGTCILAYIILNEAISLQQFLGMTVIMIGMAIYFYKHNR